MSKTAQLLKVIEGSHVLGIDGLRDYHCAKAVTNAGRIRSGIAFQYHAVAIALKNHRVMVSIDPRGVRVFRPETHQEWLLGT